MELERSWSSVAFAALGIRTRSQVSKINGLRSREGSPVVALPPPLAPMNPHSDPPGGKKLS